MSGYPPVPYCYVCGANHTGQCPLPLSPQIMPSWQPVPISQPVPVPPVPPFAPYTKFTPIGNPVKALESRVTELERQLAELRAKLRNL